MNPAFSEIMGIRGRGMPADGEVAIAGKDPVFSARFRIGEATANILAGVGVAVTDIHEMKTGKRQKVAIDVRHAAATCCRTSSSVAGLCFSPPAMPETGGEFRRSAASTLCAASS